VRERGLWTSYPTVFREDPVGGVVASADLHFRFTHAIGSSGDAVVAAPFTMTGRLVLRPESAFDTIVYKKPDLFEFRVGDGLLEDACGSD
jgi:hypothetical protein